MAYLTVHVNTEPTWRGGEQQTLYLLEGLRRRGMPTVLFAAPGSPLEERAREGGFEVKPLRIRSEADVPAMMKLSRSLRELRPALIHLHTSHAHTIGVCAAALSGNGIKRVVSRRVNFSIFRHSFLGLNWIKYCYGVDRYLTVSASVRDVLVKDGVNPARIRVVHSGVDPERFRGASRSSRSRLIREWGLPEEVPLVGAIGVLVPWKGFHHLIEAASLLVSRYPCSFVIAGEGPQRLELERLVRQAGLEDRFRLVGFRSDIGDLLGAFDIFVSASLEEGLGTSILDALLLERPVIACRVGGIPEVLEHERNGLLVEPGKPEELARAIGRLLVDPTEASRMARSGRALVLENFGVESMVEKTVQAYRELLR